MAKKWKFIVGFILTIIALYLFVTNYVYGGHKDYTKAAIVYQFNSLDSYETIVSKEVGYIEKAVAVKGFVTEIETNTVVLNDLFLMYFDGLPKEIKVGDFINVKGRYIGNDELLEQIKIDQCSLLNK